MSLRGRFIAYLAVFHAIGAALVFVVVRRYPVWVFAGEAAFAASLAIELTRLRAGDGAPASAERGGLAGWQRRIVCDFMNDNLDRDISLEELAGLARLSPTHFCRAFRRSLGMPPHRYHIHRRLEHAKTLLADRESSITAVAMASGFGAPSSFATAFRKGTGLTPQQYRRSLF